MPPFSGIVPRLWLASALLLAATARAADAEGPTFGWATIEPLGYSVYPLPSRGAELDYLLSPDAALALSFAKGAADQLLTRYESTLLLVRYKQLIGSLSQANFGIGARTLAEALDVPTAGGSATARAKNTALAAEASFGSRFAVGPVLIACDWLGVVLPLASLAKTESYPADADPAERDVDRANFASLTGKPSLELLRLSLGVQF